MAHTGVVRKHKKILSLFSDRLGAKVVQHEPLAPEPLIEASERIFGIADVPEFKMEEADFILSVPGYRRCLTHSLRYPGRVSLRLILMMQGSGT